MATTILELANRSSTLSRELEEAYGPCSNQEELKARVKQFAETEKLLADLIRPHRDRPRQAPFIPMKEAVHTADFRVLFPKVISNLLQAPVEPMYIGQSLLARTIQVDGNRMIEFPTYAPIRAEELSDTQELPE